MLDKRSRTPSIRSFNSMSLSAVISPNSKETLNFLTEKYPCSEIPIQYQVTFRHDPEFCGPTVKSKSCFWLGGAQGVLSETSVVAPTEKKIL